MEKQNEFEKDISGINYAIIINYLEERGKDPSLIFERTGITRELLTDRREFIDLKTGVVVFNTAKEILGNQDPMIFYDIAKEASKMQSLGPILDIARPLGNIEESVRFVPRFNSKFADLFDMQVFNASSNSAILTIEYKKKEYEGVWIYDQCAWNKGHIAGIPGVWDMPFMDIEEPLCRFSLEEIFRDYSYKKHKFEIKDGRGFFEGEEFAVKVKLRKESLKESLDLVDRINPFAKPKEVSVYSNEDYEIVGGGELYQEVNQATSMLITRDIRISDRLILRRGEIYGAPHCRMHLHWQSKKKLSRFLKDATYGKIAYRKRLIQSLEEELEVNKEQKFELNKAHKELQLKHQELQNAKTQVEDYAQNLEKMVEQRTSEFKEQKDIAERALSEKEKAENLAIQQEKMAAMGRLLYDLSHAFKNPMVSVTEAQELLEKGLEKRDYIYEDLEKTNLKKAHIKLLLKQRNKIKENALRSGTPTTIERLKAKKDLDELTDRYSVQFGDELKDRMLRFDIQGKSYRALAAILKQFPENKELVIDYLENEYNITINLRDLGTASNSLKASIGSILSLARKDMKPSAFNIHQGLEDILHLTSAEYKKIIFNRKYYDDLPKVVGYQSQINDALRNIITNSIEALRGDGEITITTSKQDKYVHVIISDNGPGIPADIQNKVLNPFFTTKEYGKGTGLGLSLSYEIISKNHKGELTFDSKPGETNFYLRLPTES